MAVEAGAFGPRRWDEAFVHDLMIGEGVQTLVAEDEGVVAYVMFAIPRPTRPWRCCRWPYPVFPPQGHRQRPNGRGGIHRR